MKLQHKEELLQGYDAVHCSIYCSWPLTDVLEEWGASSGKHLQEQGSYYTASAMQPQGVHGCNGTNPFPRRKHTRVAKGNKWICTNETVIFTVARTSNLTFKIYEKYILCTSRSTNIIKVLTVFHEIQTPEEDKQLQVKYLITNSD
jgi:hypothetical protein